MAMERQGRARQKEQTLATRTRIYPSVQTRKRILDTAEKLFGERGIAAVSLRDINRSAGISQGVLHYHFGGRDALVEAILDRWLPTINSERIQMYQALLASQRRIEPRDVMEIVCLPLARLAMARSPGGRRFLRFLARVHQERHPARTWVSEKHDDVPVIKLLLAAIPGSSRPRVEWYMGMVMNLIHATLGDVGRPGQPWQTALAESPLSAEQQVNDLVDFLCNGLAAL
jgi:AcrR family transcriptional regulator